MRRLASPASLEDRAASILAKSGGEGLLGDLAAQLLRTSGSAVAEEVLGRLLSSDPRFTIREGRLILSPPASGGIHPGMPIGEVPLAVVDFETTGWGTGDRAIEVGVACFEGGRETEAFQALLDPGVPPSAFVTRLTGICAGDLRGQPAFSDVWPTLSELFRGRVVVAHNLPFDMGVLGRELLLHRGAESFPHGGRLCTLKLARRLVPRGESRGLDALAQRFALRFVARHRALDDARVAGRLFYRLVSLAGESRAMGTWGDLQDLLGE